MTGPNAYKEFDTSSIVSTSTNKDTISLGKFALKKREVLLGGIAIIALLGVLVLAIVLAVKASDWKSENGDGVTSGSSSKKTGVPAEYCDTLECLQAAVYQKPILDDAILPCDDFYTFACGHYAAHHQQTPTLNDVTAANEIISENTRKLVYLLDHPIEMNAQNHYEKKVKEFMMSCNNHFDKMDLRGFPLINKVIKPLGGWWVFGDDVLDKFDLQTTLEKVHINFWTDALFNMFVKTDINNWNNKIVELDFGGMGLSYHYYQSSPYLALVQEYYRNYMSRLAIMLSVDNRMTPDYDRITQFSEDAYEVERVLATILSSSTPLINPHLPEYLMTLSELDNHMNGSLDFVHYMKTSFNQYPGKFNGDTKVAVKRLGYFESLGTVLDSYMKNDENGTRKLHNYLMWRVIQKYAKDLSWDYIHAERKLNHVMYGYKDDSSGYVYCFTQAMNSFGDAINAIFIKKFVKNEGKQEAEKIMTEIRGILLKGISNLPWMSDANRKYASKKIRHSLYKIGFPKELTDDNYLNNEYSYVTISKSDYFGNIINLNKLKRNLYNSLVGKPGSRTEWAYHVFDPLIEYYNPWHELTVTSAALQSPMFSHNGPKYYNYGGVGSIIATSLIHAIDEFGSYYKEDGSNFDNWWSNTTRTHYSEVKTCAIKAQENLKIGPFVSADGKSYPVNVSLYERDWAPQLLADSSGIRISYMAYKNQQKKDGNEKIPPAFKKYNADQMFFLSYAQSHCQNTPDVVKNYRLASYGTYPSKARVNLAITEVPEFRKAFNCPATPNQSKKCLLFNL